MRKQPKNESSKQTGLYQRLQKARETIQSRAVITTRNEKEVLESRARELSQKVEKKEKITAYSEILEFILGGERYAIETKYIREIYPMKEYTVLPCTPPFIMGIINVHRQIITIIDMKKFFDLPEKGLTDLNKVIIVRKEDMELGILADEVRSILNMDDYELQPALSTLTDLRADFLRGVTSQGLIVIDALKLLSDERIIVHEEV